MATKTQLQIVNIAQRNIYSEDLANHIVECSNCHGEFLFQFNEKAEKIPNTDQETKDFISNCAEQIVTIVDYKGYHGEGIGIIVRKVTGEQKEFFEKKRQEMINIIKEINPNYIAPDINAIKNNNTLSFIGSLIGGLIFVLIVLLWIFSGYIFG